MTQLLKGLPKINTKINEIETKKATPKEGILKEELTILLMDEKEKM